MGDSMCFGILCSTDSYSYILMFLKYVAVYKQKILSEVKWFEVQKIKLGEVETACKQNF